MVEYGPDPDYGASVTDETLVRFPAGVVEQVGEHRLVLENRARQMNRAR